MKTEKDETIYQPIEGKDYYTAELRRYVVSIEVYFDATDEQEEQDIISKAITGFREGMLDGDANIVHSELIRKVELDFNTGFPFDRKDWALKELRGKGLNQNGLPLSPSEKTRPKEERKISEFLEVGL